MEAELVEGPAIIVAAPFYHAAWAISWTVWHGRELVGKVDF
jgi:hypothetical protein